MINLNEQLQYGFETYHADGTLLDKITGPGNPGSWLCTPDSPDEVAYYPISSAEFLKMISDHTTYKMIRYKIDDNRIEIPDTRESFCLCVVRSIKEAFEIARIISVAYFYFSEWDCERITIILNRDGSEDPYKAKDFVSYTSEYIYS